MSRNPRTESGAARRGRMQEARTLAFLFALLGIVSWGTPPVRADELSELKEHLEAMELRHRESMEALQRRIDSLEAVQGHITPDRPREAEEEPQVDPDVVYLNWQTESLISRVDKLADLNLYVTLEFENFERTDAVFDARNVELLIDIHPTDRLRAFAEIELERTAKTSSSSRQGEVEVEQGWVEYTINAYLKPRLGVILVPFGRFNFEHFDPFRDLTDRPIAMRRVVPVTWAEAGAGFTGGAFLGKPLGVDLSIDYQMFMINGLTSIISDTGTRAARGAFGKDNNNNKAAVGRAKLNLSGQSVGLSGYVGKYNDADDEQVTGVDVDWHFTHGPLELIGEYARFDLARGVQGDGATTVPKFLHGGYIQTNYHFWPAVLDSTFLGRHFPAPTFTAVLRYGQARIDDDGDLGLGLNREERWTIGMNYRPVETFVFKAEYQINETKNEVLERGDRNGFITSVSAAF